MPAGHGVSFVTVPAAVADMQYPPDTPFPLPMMSPPHLECNLFAYRTHARQYSDRPVASSFLSGAVMAEMPPPVDTIGVASNSILSALVQGRGLSA